jgi:transposase
MKVSTLHELIGRILRKQTGSARKAEELYEAAQKSIGLKQIGSADRYRVGMCREEVKRTVMTLKNIDIQLKRMLKEIPPASYLTEHPRHRPLFCGSVYRKNRGSCEFP